MPTPPNERSTTGPQGPQRPDGPRQTDQLQSSATVVKNLAEAITGRLCAEIIVKQTHHALRPEDEQRFRVQTAQASVRPTEGTVAFANSGLATQAFYLGAYLFLRNGDSTHGTRGYLERAEGLVTWTNALVEVSGVANDPQRRAIVEKFANASWEHRDELRSSDEQQDRENLAEQAEIDLSIYGLVIWAGAPRQGEQASGFLNDAVFTPEGSRQLVNQLVGLGMSYDPDLGRRGHRG